MWLMSIYIYKYFPNKCPCVAGNPSTSASGTDATEQTEPMEEEKPTKTESTASTSQEQS